MQAKLTLEGTDDALRLVAGFSARRMNAVVATTLTRSVRELERDWLGEIASKIDRPTSFTLGAIGLETATASRLRAQLFIKDKPARAGAPGPVEWLGPQEEGGSRFVKKFERALIAQGSMPRGQQVVPGRYAVLDSYGNVSRAQIIDVIRQLGQQYSPGYARVISANAQKRMAAAKRSGREYFSVLTRRGRLKPGIYQRNGRALLPVFLFKSTVTYRRNTSFTGDASAAAPEIIAREGTRALQEHINSVRAKRGAA